MRLQFYYDYSYARADFPDDALGDCVLMEAIPMHRRPMILLGRYHAEMLLDRGSVRMLLPYLKHFVQTGKIVDPPREDWSI